VRPILWSNASSIGREALRAGGKIAADIADNPSNTNVRDILSKHVSASAQNIIKNLQGGGGLGIVGVSRKRKRAASSKPRKRRAKKAKISKRKSKSKSKSSKRKRKAYSQTIKRDIFS